MAKAGGLLVVVEQWRDGDEQSAQDLSASDLPVAVIDGRTWRSLQRLGSASPLADTKTVFEPVEAAAPEDNPLHGLSAQKLRSAEVLLEQQCSAGVMDLLASALLLKVAALHGETQAPGPTDAAVWLYSDIVPRGLLTAEQAALVVQVVSLSLGSGLPDALIGQAAADTGRLFAALV